LILAGSLLIKIFKQKWPKGRAFWYSRQHREGRRELSEHKKDGISIPVALVLLVVK
jgi:hypothetical protein